MFGNAVFCLIFLITINFYSVTTDHWIYSRPTVQPKIENNVNELRNETDFLEDLIENNVTSTTENDILFWTKGETNETAETVPEMEMELDKLDKGQESINTTLQSLEETTEMEVNVTTPISLSTTEILHDNSDVLQKDEEGPKPEVNHSNYVTPNDMPGLKPEISPSNNVTNLSDPEPEENQTTNVIQNGVPDVPDIMDEKIILQRNNCHLEIDIQETHDLKIEIRFGKLQNNTSGKCCITLNGQENNNLGVLVSNIYLHENGSRGEVLKVVTANHGSGYVLKEYYSRTSYQPLLLTETQRVYLVLYYNVGSVLPNEQDSHFNLEVFSYHRYGNYIHQGNSYTESYFPHHKDVGHLPTEESYFATYNNYY